MSTTDKNENGIWISDLVKRAGLISNLVESLSTMIGIAMASSVAYTFYLRYLKIYMNTLVISTIPFVSLIFAIISTPIIKQLIIRIRKSIVVVLFSSLYIISIVLIIVSVYFELPNDTLIFGLLTFFVVSFLHLLLASYSRGLLYNLDKRILSYYVLIPIISRYLLVDKFNRKRFLKVIFFYFISIGIASVIISFPIVTTFVVLDSLSIKSAIALLDQFSRFALLSAFVFFIIFIIYITYLFNVEYNILNNVTITIQVEDTTDQKKDYPFPLFITDVYTHLYDDYEYSKNTDKKKDINKYPTFLFLFLLGDVYLSLVNFYNSNKSEASVVDIEKCSFILAFHEYTKLLLDLRKYDNTDCNTNIKAFLTNYLREIENLGNPGAVVLLENEGLIYEDINPIEVKYNIKLSKN